MLPSPHYAGFFIFNMNIHFSSATDLHATPQETTMKTYYSTDDENYSHETVGDALDALDSDGRLAAGTSYWEADFLPMEPQQALDAAQVLELADERGYDMIGEAWDNPFTVSRDAQVELQTLLDTWAKKHVDLSIYYTMVGKPRHLVVADADLPANA